MTMAPLVAKDKLIVGDFGGEMGVRGWAAALDQATGKVVWKAYSTGPDNEVLIGPDFKPFYSQYKGRTSASRLGRLICGGRAAEPFGAGSHMIPNSTSSITEPPILDRGIRRCGRATICGPLASSPATRTRDKRVGSIKRALTTCRTTTASTSRYWSIPPGTEAA